MGGGEGNGSYRMNGRKKGIQGYPGDSAGGGKGGLRNE